MRVTVSWEWHCSSKTHEDNSATDVKTWKLPFAQDASVLSLVSEAYAAAEPKYAEKRKALQQICHKHGEL